MRRLILPAIALISFSLAVFPQAAGWNDPFPAHRVMDNFYYVGTKELASFLISTPEGLILMNSNYEASVPVIQASVKEMGFDFKNIKILISGHAHPDHVEGDALVKQLTGAQVVVGRKEVEAVQKIRPGGKDHPIDRLVDDGDTVTLGGTTLTAHEMPGHTRGCLAWSLNLKEGGKTYYAFVECSLNGQFLRSLEQYPGIVDDFRAERVNWRQTANASLRFELLPGHYSLEGRAEGGLLARTEFKAEPGLVVSLEFVPAAK